MDGNQKTNGILLGLFVGSGCSALIYEVIWFQQLGLVLGASAISLAILLTSFMGGMCLGSIAFSKVIPLRWHPLRVYAVLELLIAACGLGVLWLLPVVGRFYWSLAGGSANDLWMRSTVALALLVPPTVLMGATLPAVSRWVESSRDGLSQLGLFYGANTFGAVLGSLLAGLYLLRVYDIAVATYVAAIINVAVATVAAWMAQWTTFHPLFHRPQHRNKVGMVANDGCQRRNWHVGPNRFGGGSCLDAVARTVARPNRLYVFDRAGRFSAGTGLGKHRGSDSRPTSPISGRGAGGLPVAVDGGDSVCRVHHHARAAVLAFVPCCGSIGMD